jgi:predicted ATP-dependent endonuclease of OLD family
MLGLIELARLKLEELTNPQNTQALKNKLQGASNHLSGKILQYWSQNKHLHVQFDLRPALPGDPPEMNTAGTTNLWGEVYDSAHGATVRLGTRSKGFIWFFSFLAWFSQQRRKGVPLILLLDEPGLVLHASAQGDLLNYIEVELKPHHQVLYTTHSPFMVRL